MWSYVGLSIGDLLSGALSQCEGKLCARVGAQPKRFGKNGEYVQIAE